MKKQKLPQEILNLSLKYKESWWCASTTRYRFTDIISGKDYHMTQMNFVPILLKYGMIDQVIAGEFISLRNGDTLALPIDEVTNV